MRAASRALGLAFLGFAVAVSAARGASLTVTGAAGDSPTKPPLNAGFGLPGLAGGNGEDAVATVTGADAVNDATAIGGAGGNGGPGGDVDPNTITGLTLGGAGGAGGNGGSANATAQTDVATGDTSASASASGGAGALGGPQGNPNAMSVGLPANFVGAPGVGGSSTAQSSARSLAGSATALSQAGSLATSEAESHDGTATATSSGGSPVATASSIGEVGGATATATSTAASNINSSAESHASAVTHGPGDAVATASATGSGPAQPPQFPSQLPPSGQAIVSADAVSDHGNATATVHGTAGAGAPPSLVGITVSGTVISGTQGGDITLIDAVHGSSPLKLTLTQEATGGLSGGPGGQPQTAKAQSILHAENPGGGELVAEAIAHGGDGVLVSLPRVLGTPGGDGVADAVAVDTHGARVEAHALAAGGTGWFFMNPVPGGADATASARGLGDVVALADTQSFVYAHQRAIAESLGAGPIRRAGTELNADPILQYATIGLGLHAETRLNAAAGLSGATPPSGSQNRLAELFAAPHAADVATWTQGNAHVEDALGGKTVLALGNIAAAGGGDVAYGGSKSVVGSLQLDLDAGSFSEGTSLGIAFMDPIAGATSLDLLHLSFSVDGVVQFDRTFNDAASAVAALDDAVYSLEPLVTTQGTVRQLVLSFDVELQDFTGVAFDVAVFVPEPTPLALLAAGLILLLAFRPRLTSPRHLPSSRPPAP